MPLFGLISNYPCGNCADDDSNDDKHESGDINHPPMFRCADGQVKLALSLLNDSHGFANGPKRADHDAEDEKPHQAEGDRPQPNEDRLSIGSGL